MSKGSWRRPGNSQLFNENWEKIFGNSKRASGKTANRSGVYDSAGADKGDTGKAPGGYGARRLPRKHRKGASDS